MPSLRLLLLLFCCFVVVGCAKDSRSSVSGNVTFDGVPIKEGSIAFMPTGDSGSGGSGAIVDGKYNVLVTPGQMMVQIYAQREPTPQEIQARERDSMSSSMMSDAPAKIQYIPEKYNVKSTLRADIQQTQRDLNFDLTTE